jgi:hypothetical protein
LNIGLDRDSIRNYNNLIQLFVLYNYYISQFNFNLFP